MREIKSSREARIEEVIIYTESIGEGKQGDPYRQLLVVRDKNGEFIAERDKWEELHNSKKDK